MILTIGHEVDLDCVPCYRCRGDVDVNLPNWLGLELATTTAPNSTSFGWIRWPIPITRQADLSAGRSRRLDLCVARRHGAATAENGHDRVAPTWTAPIDAN
jgi:hypothetical protein